MLIQMPSLQAPVTGDSHYPVQQNMKCQIVLSLCVALLPEPAEIGSRTHYSQLARGGQHGLCFSAQTKRATLPPKVMA